MIFDDHSRHRSRPGPDSHDLNMTPIASFLSQFAVSIKVDPRAGGELSTDLIPSSVAKKRKKRRSRWQTCASGENLYTDYQMNFMSFSLKVLLYSQAIAGANILIWMVERAEGRFDDAIHLIPPNNFFTLTTFLSNFTFLPADATFHH